MIHLMLNNTCKPTRKLFCLLNTTFIPACNIRDVGLKRILVKTIYTKKLSILLFIIFDTSSCFALIKKSNAIMALAINLFTEFIFVNLFLPLNLYQICINVNINMYLFMYQSVEKSNDR